MSHKKKANSFSFLIRIGVLLAFVAIGLTCFGIHIPSLLLTVGLQLKTGAHGFFGVGLLTHEALSAIPISTYIQLGYWNSLQLKTIYLLRQWLKDNFLFEDWLASVHKTLLEDFERRGVPKDADSIYQIPSFRFDEISAQKYFNDYVKLGRPVIIKGMYDLPAMHWTPDILKERVGEFSTTTRCMDGTTRKWTLADYVNSRNDTGVPCYFDNNADIFEKYPHLLDEVDINRFAEHMTGKPSVNGTNPSLYLFSQLFMSVFNSTGALFHCANFNNLFYMIQGRKKWTFVDPSNSFLIYPMFNNMMKDSKSFLVWNVLHANNSDEIVAKHFPLYRYAPKYVYTLERGDILLNPPWNWHMVENYDQESIGIASRWLMAAPWPYTNALFSFLQFSSWEFTSFLYKRIASKAGWYEFKYHPTAHQNLDEQVNFGNFGSVYAHKSFTQAMIHPNQWAQYVDYLKNNSYAFKNEL